jgi:hypothetical protein
MRLLAGAVVLAAMLTPSEVVAADHASVEQAVNSGVNALRRIQQPDGHWQFSTEPMSVGATALAGLTLLECGISKEDPAVINAARYVRIQSARLRFTYSVALSLLFLDRLGDPGDDLLIASLAARLVAGQCPTGAWHYDCPDPLALNSQNVAIDKANQKPKVPGRANASASDPDPALREFERSLRILRMQKGPTSGDNSITQFAALALWVAHRRGLPVENSLRAVDRRFRLTQNADGGWPYADPGIPNQRAAQLRGSTPTMTCAGLLGIWIGSAANWSKDKEKGQERSGRNANNDPTLKLALRSVARSIGVPYAALPSSPEAQGGDNVHNQPAGRAFYYLRCLFSGPWPSRAFVSQDRRS